MSIRPGTLADVLACDAENIRTSEALLERHGLLDLFQRMPGLLETLGREVAGYIGDTNGLVNTLATGEEVLRQDVLLRTFMLESAWVQFVMAASHLLRGQLGEIHKDVRRAVEAAGIAYLSRSEPDLGAVFLSGDRKAMRNLTASGKLFPRNDSHLAFLGDKFDYSSKQSHNNFASFVGRFESTIGAEADGRPHVLMQFSPHDDADAATVAGTAVSLLRTAWVAAHVLAKSFGLPDCTWHRRMEHFDRELTEAGRPLSAILRARVERLRVVDV